MLINDSDSTVYLCVDSYFMRKEQHREKFQTSDIPKSPRIQKLVDALYANMPVIESARAKLITESYKETEGEPIITRRAKAFAHILRNIPIIIRDDELIVGSSTIAPRGCQTFPEFSYEWLEAELDTVATRTADPFEIAEETKAELREADKYWKGKNNQRACYFLYGTGSDQSDRTQYFYTWELFLQWCRTCNS